jgi:hypothetical protein
MFRAGVEEGKEIATCRCFSVAGNVVRASGRRARRLLQPSTPALSAEPDFFASVNQFTLVRADGRDSGDCPVRVLDNPIRQRGEHAMRMKHQITAGPADALIESFDAWMKIRAARQVAEYIHDLTAELSRMAKSAECGSLASVLQIASLEAKKAAQEHGCEALLNGAREESSHSPEWTPYQPS